MKMKSLVILLAVVSTAYTQSFKSGSTGADGVLALTTPGTIIFNPRAFNPPLNPSGDNVYHFTSIYIAKDVTVRLLSKNLSSPVFWLAQGPVDIEGTVDLTGGEGASIPSIAGAGGYAGGAARKSGYSPGTFRSNVFLVPLVGGSGGDGGETQGGGAGGGALLIASSSSIAIDGTITANGGRSSDGVGGNGGAIRLVSPVIEGSGQLSAKAGQPGGADGFIRFEALDNQFKGSLSGTPHAQGKPFGLFLPPNPQASVRVVSIGGIAVTARHYTIERPSTVPVVIEAHFIPPGTVVQLEFFPANGPSLQIGSSPLEGTFELSHATASVAFPSGVSRGLVEATWNQPSQSEPPR
jgi:hypothetical protein